MTKGEVVTALLSVVLVLLLILGGWLYERGQLAWLGGPTRLVTHTSCDCLVGPDGCGNVVSACNVTQTAEAVQMQGAKVLSTPPAWWPWGH